MSEYEKLNQRLVDRFPIGVQVEIRFADSAWHTGQILRHDHPGVWAQTADGMVWFITNGRHIRRRNRPEDNG